MTNPHSTKPIGIFDSGIGGLTVAQSIVTHLPKENMIYFGDTAHMPYGDKSAAVIQSYSLKIADLLLQKQCKLILIACYSATSAAYENIQAFVGDNAIVMNMIDPMVQHIQQYHAQKRLGLIGTRQTVNSNVYKNKIALLNQNIQLASLATNLLAAAIEEFGNSDMLDILLKEYLSHPTLKNLDALILACTHYPVVKARIAKYFNHQIEVIDPSDVVAKAVKDCLKQKNLLNENGKGNKHFYISDYTDSFAAGTKIFFNETIQLEHYPLWETMS